MNQFPVNFSTLRIGVLTPPKVPEITPVLTPLREESFKQKHGGKVVNPDSILDHVLYIPKQFH
jgi:hypothetical protein